MQSKLLLFFFLSFFSSISCLAQIDSHYWTHQYGAQGLLLNGAVIASAEGETSLYYNPGSIGMDDNLGFAFSFLSPIYANLETKNYLGDNNSLTDSGLSFSPGFLGVRFKPFKSDKIVAGITAFKRFKTDISFEDRVVDNVNNVPIFLFRGDLDFERKISEDWYGIGFSYKLTDFLGIGFTQYSVWHSQKLNFNLKKEIVPKALPQEILFSWRSELGYKLSLSSGFITKLGLRYKHDKFNLGMTFTSRMYGIPRKKSSYYLEDHRVDTNLNYTSTTSNRNTVDLEAFRSAASVGLGVDFKLYRHVLSISMEYFEKVDEYRLFQSIDDSFDDLALEPVETSINLTSNNEQVFNISVGVMHKASDKVTILAGFRTDYDQNNSLKITNDTEYLGTTGDVFHVTGGGLFQFGKNQISFGLDLGYGTKKNGKQLADLSNLTAENIFLITGKNNVTSRFYSAMLFITYDFIFSGFRN